MKNYRETEIYQLGVTFKALGCALMDDKSTILQLQQASLDAGLSLGFVFANKDPDEGSAPAEPKPAGPPKPVGPPNTFGKS